MNSQPSPTDARDQALISIVLPCYNSQRYLRETLDSVRNQSHLNWELIAVDDCSSDQTAEMLQAAATNDPRIRYVRRESRGGKPSVSKNTGLEYVRGDYIAFIDHDDNYLPRKLELLLRALQEHPDHVAAFHDLEYIDSQSQSKGERYIPDFRSHAQDYIAELEPGVFSCGDRYPIFQALRYSGIQTTGCLLAKSRLPDGFIHYDTRYTITDDKDLWVRLALQGKLIFVNEVLAQYRVHANNLSNDSLRSHQDICQLLQVNIERLSTLASKAELSLLKTQLAQSFEHWAWSLRCKGLTGQAMKAYWHAMTLKPSLKTLASILKAGFKPQALANADHR
ncbi:glycosyltransferase family 2 protein [Paucibacter sp. Y2R2-4]|uniref:glycosyltransferase family 2 protein n=1 Tax=Paucibacter sp. Y2R2-4 TaxID=2893553 RepID=UPI0021E4ADA7|nr:glycosyltransferase family 2 protein [Paucibacter sp. Y2R2-4]MCV2348559.1 glycosyltransferase family 2 protein [Paucibacter sp. Y2R2-4]